MSETDTIPEVQFVVDDEPVECPRCGFEVQRHALEHDCAGWHHSKGVAWVHLSAIQWDLFKVARVNR